MTSCHDTMVFRRAAGVVLPGTSRMFFNLREAVKFLEKKGEAT